MTDPACLAQRLEDADEGEPITDALYHSDPKLRRCCARARLDKMRERLDRSQRR